MGYILKLFIMNLLIILRMKMTFMSVSKHTYIYVYTDVEYSVRINGNIELLSVTLFNDKNKPITIAAIFF